jgi:hypothetical protein
MGLGRSGLEDLGPPRPSLLGVTGIENPFGTLHPKFEAPFSQIPKTEIRLPMFWLGPFMWLAFTKLSQVRFLLQE